MKQKLNSHYQYKGDFSTLSGKFKKAKEKEIINLTDGEGITDTV